MASIMNVLYIIHQTTETGGSAKSFLESLKGVMAKGVKPIIVMPDDKGIYPLLCGMNIPVIVTPYRNQTYPPIRATKDYILWPLKLIARILVNYIAVYKLVKQLKGCPIDLIHTNVSVCGIGFKLSRKLHIPHIYHIREYADKDFNMHYIPNKASYLKQLAQPHSYSICITKDIQRHFHQNGNPNSEVIYDGVQQRMEEMPKEKKKFFFLFAGKIDPSKGVMELLQAYHVYKLQSKKAIPLLIIGEQANMNYLRVLNNYIQENELVENVTLSKPCEDIFPLMRTANAIFVPSRFEGFGRCMPEAMFNGCLAVARYTGGSKEQLDNGREYTGKDIGLAFTTEQQLTEIFTEIEQRPTEYYNEMVEAAFQAVNQLYSRESNAERITNFYQRILQEESNYQ